MVTQYLLGCFPASDSQHVQGHANQEQILESARHVFPREGYVAARMSDVAYEAGLSLGVVYRYFRNKEDLFSSLVSEHPPGIVRRQSGARTFFCGRPPYGALNEANLGYLKHYYVSV